MRRIVLAALLIVIVTLAVAAPAMAEEVHCESGMAFGQHHAEMAEDGMLGGEMNPGMHNGYSHCLMGE